MTTYCKIYKGLTSEQKSLLRDLLVYQISRYDIQNNIANRIAAFDFLRNIYQDNLRGFDDTMIMMNDIIKMCKPIPENRKEDLKKSALLNPDDGLIGILSIYSNETITGLKEILSSKDNMTIASTSSPCWDKIKKR